MVAYFFKSLAGKLCEQFRHSMEWRPFRLRRGFGVRERDYRCGSIQAICRYATARLFIRCDPQGLTILLVYSVHFKGNRGELQADIAKREEAARHLIAHAGEMEKGLTRRAQRSSR